MSENIRKVAVLQSNYIPWKGYFDIINDVDLFIFHDDLQYTKNDWRNRNKIKTSSGIRWLTIPVGINEHRLICDVRINDNKWQNNHFNTITQNYAKTPFFNIYKDFLYHIYVKNHWNSLSALNQYIIKTISRDFLGIKTKFGDSRDFKPAGNKHERLLNLLKSAGADIYVSGPSARDYIIEDDYTEAGIKIIWKDYSDYPEYPQINGEFNHNVSILDLLFNTGTDASYYIWGWR